MAAAGVARPFLPQLKSQARATSSRKLPQIITEFSYADTTLKTGRGPRADELLERLAVDVP